jgi:hypothetical protein
MARILRFRLAYFLTALAAAIAAYWSVVLYPYWTHTGSAPGSGGQYVFVLIPTAALAWVAALTAIALIVPVLVKETSSRSGVRIAAATVASVTALAVSAFWLHVAMHSITG